MNDYPSDGIKVSFLRELARSDLLDHIKLCEGSKVMFWDRTLKGPFNLIIDWPILKKHGVVKMFDLQEKIPSEVLENKWQNVVLLIRPEIKNIDLIFRSIRSVSSAQRREIDFHIIFVSRKSTMCMRRLEEYKIVGEFKNILELELDLIPFDHDLMTLENPRSFREVFVEQDDSCLFQVARSLMTLQAYFGVIPNITVLGESAKKVQEMIERMRQEVPATDKPILPKIENLILIDRRIDLMTVVSSQVTYEGLIDEMYGIKNTQATFPGAAFQYDDEAQETAPKMVPLNSSDPIFNEARDLHFNAIGIFLTNKARQISAAYDEKKDAKSLNQLKQFVSKLPHIQAEKRALEIQTSIAGLIRKGLDKQYYESFAVEQELREGLDVEKMNTFIEEMIYKQEPLTKILRLIAVQCIAGDGLRPKLLEFYKREIVQAYGYHHLITFDRLEKCKLIYMQEKNQVISYPTLRSKLKLCVDNVNEKDPTDVSYVYSGYAPLTVRLINWLTQGSQRDGLTYLDDIVKYLPKPCFGKKQKSAGGTQERIDSSGENHTLVYFIGGCTYAEVSALRFLSQHHPNNPQFTVATTKMINGNSLLETVIEPSPKDTIPDFLT